MVDEIPEYWNDPNINHERRVEIQSHIYGRWEQLNILVDSISERASKQLFITNGTGAIALMSYFGVVKDKSEIYPEMYFSLAFFVVGVMLAMLVTAFLFYGYRSLLKGWDNDSRKFYASNISFADLDGKDVKRNAEDNGEEIATITSWASFAFFF